MNKYLKLVLAIILFAFAIFLFSQREIGWGIFVLFLMIFPILFFFKIENILMAFWFLRKENIDKTNFWLNKIKNTEKQLIKNQYGYFHYLKGIVSAQRNNLGESEKFMKEAIQYGLNFDHDRAMANLSLASSSLSKGRKKEAENYLKEAKKNDKKGMFTDQIKMINNQLKRVNVSSRQLQNPNMRSRMKRF